MTHFVLVHGSGNNASSWSRVRAGLLANGHEVVTPELPKEEPGWGLEEHAALIAEAVRDSESVVVAHSMCGVLLPWVSAIRECGLLVFVAAVIPELGKSLRGQFGEDAGMFHPEWIAAGARWFDESEQAALAREFLFHDCDEESMPWALETVEAIDSSRLVVQEATFGSWTDTPTASIVCTLDRTLTADWGRRTSRRVLGVEAIELEAGHCPMVSMPTKVVEVLVELAKRDGRPRPG